MSVAQDSSGKGPSVSGEGREFPVVGSGRLHRPAVQDASLQTGRSQITLESARVVYPFTGPTTARSIRGATSPILVFNRQISDADQVARAMRRSSQVASHTVPTVSYSRYNTLWKGPSRRKILPP
jgi:hypothetical protein